MVNNFTSKEFLKDFLVKEIPFKELEINYRIYETDAVNGISIGVSYEIDDDGEDVYIYNIFNKGHYINIANVGTKQEVLPGKVIDEIYTAIKKISSKEIHIWLTKCKGIPATIECYTDLISTEAAFARDEDIINTTLTHYCSFRWGRRVFIHIYNEVHEISLGDCEGTNRVIRDGHNIEKMLMAGEFSWFR